MAKKVNGAREPQEPSEQRASTRQPGQRSQGAGAQAPADAQGTHEREPATAPPRRARSSRRSAPQSDVAGSGAAPPTSESPPTSETPPERPAERSSAQTRHERRAAASNALGQLIEERFAEPNSPCRSYTDLERRSNISREALSRYVTGRADRRRAPTIDTLMAIADAMGFSLEEVCRAAAASARGLPLAPQDVARARGERMSSLVAPLDDDQFAALAEVARQMSRSTPAPEPERPSGGVRHGQ